MFYLHPVLMFPLTARSVQSRALPQWLARTDLFLSVTAPTEG